MSQERQNGKTDLAYYTLARVTLVLKSICFAHELLVFVEIFLMSQFSRTKYKVQNGAKIFVRMTLRRMTEP
jgi:hypothetical protein